MNCDLLSLRSSLTHSGRGRSGAGQLYEITVFACLRRGFWPLDLHDRGFKSNTFMDMCPRRSLLYCRVVEAMTGTKSRARVLQNVKRCSKSWKKNYPEKQTLIVVSITTVVVSRQDYEIIMLSVWVPISNSKSTDRYSWNEVLVLYHFRLP
jgi:hypothetical protein